MRQAGDQPSIVVIVPSDVWLRRYTQTTELHVDTSISTDFRGVLMQRGRCCRALPCCWA